MHRTSATTMPINGRRVRNTQDDSSKGGPTRQLFWLQRRVCRTHGCLAQRVARHCATKAARLTRPGDWPARRSRLHIFHVVAESCVALRTSLVYCTMEYTAPMPGFVYCTVYISLLYHPRGALVAYAQPGLLRQRGGVLLGNVWEILRPRGDIENRVRKMCDVNKTLRHQINPRSPV